MGALRDIFTPEDFGSKKVPRREGITSGLQYLKEVEARLGETTSRAVEATLAAPEAPPSSPKASGWEALTRFLPETVVQKLFGKN